MRLLGNLLHLLSGGLFVSFGWLLSAALFSVLPVTRPLARSAFQLALLCLWPAGKEAVHENAIARFQLYVRTGRIRRGRLAEFRADPVRLVQIALWLPVGAILVVGHILHAVIQALPTLSNPWESRSVSLLRIAACPLGWRVVPQSRARNSVCPGSAQLAPGESWSSPFVAALSARLAGPVAKLAGVAIVLWASGSGDALFTPPALADRIEPPAYYPLYANWVRPAAAPALPMAPQPAWVAQPGCSAAPLPALSALRLSRRPAEYALPLGSRPVPASPGDGRIALLPHLHKLQLFAISKRDDKRAGPICREAAAARVARSGAYAAEVERIRSLARKLDPDRPVWQARLGVSPIDRPRPHIIEARAVANVGRWLTSDPTAKSRAVIGADRAGDRVERAALLAARQRALHIRES